MGEATGNNSRSSGFKRRHIIDLLLPVTLFLVLAASSLFLVILAANVYQKNVAWEEKNYENRTCLSYVAEKIRQGDERGGVELGTFDGVPSIIIQQNFGEQSYITYLYCYDGMLRELFIQEGVSAGVADGQEILEVDDFRITQQEEGIFRISCVDENGRELVTWAAVKSKA